MLPLAPIWAGSNNLEGRAYLIRAQISPTWAIFSNFCLIRSSIRGFFPLSCKRKSIHRLYLTLRTKFNMTANDSAKPVAVLFVCLGNICRSTMAEGVFRDMTGTLPSSSHDPKASDRFVIDSAGTGVRLHHLLAFAFEASWR